MKTRLATLPLYLAMITALAFAAEAPPPDEAEEEGYDANGREWRVEIIHDDQNDDFIVRGTSLNNVTNVLVVAWIRCKDAQSGEWTPVWSTYSDKSDVDGTATTIVDVPADLTAGNDYMINASIEEDVDGGEGFGIEMDFDVYPDVAFFCGLRG